MICSKHAPRLAALLMAAALALCLAAGARATGETGVPMEYEKQLFDRDRLLEVNILMDQADWEAMLAGAMSEQYVQCDVQVAGQTFYRVGIRPKGNTSLSSIANDPTTDRYSFKLEFDQYVAGQTCFGLDKLVLNNSYADSTYMKEAVIYRLFQQVGADASLWNYAKVSVNGEYWGLYLALEAVEDSFLLRSYGVSPGQLYKPEGMGMGGGNMGGMFGGGGADLNYTGDSLDSYSTVWAGAVTDSGSSDHRRVVEALKNIAAGNDLERYMDIDNLLRYAAAHIFSTNSDSLSGNMAHNYYLYEQGGALNLLPWDYNLALGGMGGGRGGSGTLSSPIDDAWNGTGFFDALLAVPEYRALYHGYLQQIADYVESPEFEAFFTATRAAIDGLVQTDPNAFYSYQEFQTGADTLLEALKLRARSVRQQLAGESGAVDQSQIDLSAMGSMNMGDGRDFGDRAQPTDRQEDQEDRRPQGGWQMPEGGFELPEGFDPGQMGGERPNGGFGDRVPATGTQTGTDRDALLLYGVSGAVMLAALAIAALYRRRPRRR